MVTLPDTVEDLTICGPLEFCLQIATDEFVLLVEGATDCAGEDDDNDC